MGNGFSRSANREERDQGYVVYTRKRTREIYSFIGILIGYSFWTIFFFFSPLMMIFFFNPRKNDSYFIKIRTKGRRLITFFLLNFCILKIVFSHLPFVKTFSPFLITDVSRER